MTKDADFKALVRARAAETGESYQTARRQLRPDADSPSPATEPARDFDALVEQLDRKGEWPLAFHALMDAAPDHPEARAAVRRGLHHDSPVVRYRCCAVLDHHLDEEAVPDLIENLSHPNAKVRTWAVHTLACDRCKEGECRPGEDLVVPIVVRMLTEDRAHKVRSSCAALLGAMLVRRPDLGVHIERAAAADPHPKVRTIAGWYVPGSRIHKRMLEKAAIAERKAAREAARAAWEAAHPRPATADPQPGVR